MASTPAPLRPLRAAQYSTIRDRGSHAVRDDVRRELNAIINAAPTQIHPDDREGYLDALLSDLEAVGGAVWTQWPEDLLLLALTAVRYLGRNPIGSQTLLTTAHLSTLLFHSALPFGLSLGSSSDTSSAPGSASSTTVSPTAPPPYSPQALEALKVLANLLVLHPAGRNRFHNAGGARVTAIALAGKDARGTDHEGLEEKERERVFLLGRLGFLVTVERKGAVEIMVDQEGIVESLVYYLTNLGPVLHSFAALAEVLKLATNIVRFHPKSSSSAEDSWDERFDPLLASVLYLVHTLPLASLVPPLSNAIQFLLFAPLLPRLTTAWCSVPEPASPSPSTSSVRSLLNKLGQISIPGSGSGSGSNHPRKGSSDKSAETSPGGGGLSVPRAKSPNPPGRRSMDGRKSPEPVGFSTRGTAATSPTRIDPTALPARLLRVLEDWFASFLPYGRKVDEDRTDGIVVDEVLPPLILVLMKLAKGNGDMRAYLKEALLPPDLDRSPEAGPLEQRDSTLGTILRLMQCSTHSATRDSAGELMWVICNEDASTLSVEIGYGNAAGVLFQKGISGPPPATIEEIPDEPTSSTTALPQSQASLPAPAPVPGQIPVSPVHIGTDPGSRHPITALSSGEGDDPTALLAAMSQEEKEREAERLFVLFGRMEKNPIISASTGSTPGQDGGEGRSVNEVIGERMRSREMEAWGQREDEAERTREREREEREEREALRDLEEYKKRAKSGRN